MINYKFGIYDEEKFEFSLYNFKKIEFNLNGLVKKTSYV